MDTPENDGNYTNGYTLNQNLFPLEVKPTENAEESPEIVDELNISSKMATQKIVDKIRTSRDFSIENNQNSSELQIFWGCF